MNKCTRCGEVNPAEIHTCSPQTKALRLADILQHKIPSIQCLEEAAAELRRLDALNAELVEALEDAIDSVGRFTSEEGSTDRDFVILDNAIAAVCKAKEQT